jgi:hypothetical protein
MAGLRPGAGSQIQHERKGAQAEGGTSGRGPERKKAQAEEGGIQHERKRLLVAVFGVAVGV